MTRFGTFLASRHIHIYIHVYLHTCIPVYVACERKTKQKGANARGQLPGSVSTANERARIKTRNNRTKSKCAYERASTKLFSLRMYACKWYSMSICCKMLIIVN